MTVPIPSARLRGIIHLLRTQREFKRHQWVEIADQLEQIEKSFPVLSSRIKAVLKGLQASLVVQPNGNYYVSDREYFTAAADLLFTINTDDL